MRRSTTKRGCLMWLHQLFWVALILGLAAPAFAQGKAAGKRRAKVEQRVEEIVGRVLREKVGLDDKKATQVEALLKKHHKARAQAKRDQHRARRALGQLLKQNSSDQKAYAKAINDFRQAQKALHQLEDKQFDELGKVLTPKQQAQLYANLDKVRRKVRVALRKHRQKQRRAKGKRRGKDKADDGDWGDFD